MSHEPDPDAELLAELGEMIDRADPVPGEATAFAKAAFGWRRLDSDLAELLEDSLLETSSPARSEGGRWLAFGAEGLAIDVEVKTDGGERVLLGQLAPPPAEATVEVQAGSGDILGSAETDPLGRFRLTLESGGRIRLQVVVRHPPGEPIETSWFSI